MTSQYEAGSSTHARVKTGGTVLCFYQTPPRGRKKAPKTFGKPTVSRVHFRSKSISKSEHSFHNCGRCRKTSSWSCSHMPLSFFFFLPGAQRLPPSYAHWNKVLIPFENFFWSNGHSLEIKDACCWQRIKWRSTAPIIRKGKNIVCSNSREWLRGILSWTTGIKEWKLGGKKKVNHALNKEHSRKKMPYCFWKRKLNNFSTCSLWLFVRSRSVEFPIPCYCSRDRSCVHIAWELNLPNV